MSLNFMDYDSLVDGMLALHSESGKFTKFTKVNLHSCDLSRRPTMSSKRLHLILMH